MSNNITHKSIELETSIKLKSEKIDENSEKEQTDELLTNEKFIRLDEDSKKSC